MKIGSIVIDCDDFDRMMNFWRDALHYVPKHSPENGWVILKDPSTRASTAALKHCQGIY